VEYAYPASLQAAIANDEDLNRLLPFLALPDGAHLVSFRLRMSRMNKLTTSPKKTTPTL
jgi:hypothetical protein